MNKGKIDPGGILWIERGGKMKELECPFEKIECCDECALWHDIGHMTSLFSSDESTPFVQICKTKHYFKELIDERTDPPTIYKIE